MIEDAIRGHLLLAEDVCPAGRILGDDFASVFFRQGSVFIGICDQGVLRALKKFPIPLFALYSL